MNTEWLDVIIDGKLVQISGEQAIKKFISSLRGDQEISFKIGNPRKNLPEFICFECRMHSTEPQCKAIKENVFDCLKEKGKKLS